MTNETYIDIFGGMCDIYTDDNATSFVMFPDNDAVRMIHRLDGNVIDVIDLEI